MRDLATELATALAGRYSIVRPIGQGGAATVYLTHDLKHDRPVALKVLDPSVASGVGAERFLREIRFAAQGRFLKRDMLTPETLTHIEALNAMAADRGQSLAQMAIAWTLRDPRVTSSLIGASSVAQLEDNVAPFGRLDFTDDELEEVDRYATESSINIWAGSSEV